MKKNRLLCMGHSYILAVNRATVREIAGYTDFEITVVAPSKFHGDLRSLELEPEPPGSPLRLLAVDARSTRSIHVFHYNAGQLENIISSSEYDLVFGWQEPYILAGWQLARAARRRGIKYCFYTAQNLNKRYPPPFSWFEKDSVRSAAGWIAGGELVFRVLCERGYKAETGAILPLAVDTSLFRPATEVERLSTLEELGLQPPVIGFMGRLHADKGVTLLRKALELLPPGIPWSALFLGSGPEEQVLLEWARKHGWLDRVRVMLARHHEVPRYLAAMDVLAAPSQTTRHWKEQFGRMLVEAFTCGVPVIGSDSGEIPYVLGPAGVILPEDDAYAWAREIAALLADSGRREKLKQLGQRRALDFGAPAVAAKYADFYRKIIAAN